MKIRMFAVLMVLICGGIFAADRLSLSATAYFLDVAMVDESQTPALTQRVVVGVAGDGVVHYQNGGEIPPSGEGSAIQFGRILDASIARQKNGAHWIEMTFEDSCKFIAKANGPTTHVVLADVLKLHTDLTVGKSKRVQLGQQRYCDITLRLD